MGENSSLIQRLEKAIVNVADFPKEGIQFKDITLSFSTLSSTAM